MIENIPNTTSLFLNIPSAQPQWLATHSDQLSLVLIIHTWWQAERSLDCYFSRNPNISFVNGFYWFKLFGFQNKIKAIYAHLNNFSNISLAWFFSFLWLFFWLKLLSFQEWTYLYPFVVKSISLRAIQLDLCLWGGKFETAEGNLLSVCENEGLCGKDWSQARWVFTHSNNFAYLINFSPQALKTDPEGTGLETCSPGLHWSVA